MRIQVTRQIITIYYFPGFTHVYREVINETTASDIWSNGYLEYNISQHELSTSNDQIRASRVSVTIVVSRKVVNVRRNRNVKADRFRFRSVRYRARCILQEVHAKTQRGVKFERMVHEHVGRYR